MTAVGQWRGTYAPGDWLVLCGPASVVVLEPPGAGWTPLVAELWEQVLAAHSLVDLAARLAVYGLDTMPSFGALFWTPEGMRSLVRGAVSVVDPASGRVVADGEGIQTWSEVGLGDLRTARIETNSTAGSDALLLPLVAGAVRASWVLLDAQEQARMHSPQLDQGRTEPERSGGAKEPTQPTEPMDPPTPMSLLVSGGPDGAADGAELTSVLPHPPGEPERTDTALMTVPPVAAEPGPTPQPPAPPSRPTVQATVCPHGHPNPPDADHCRACAAQILDHRPRPVAQPILALLRSSDGGETPLDRPVLVGRAPTDKTGGGAHLLTVPSPGHDISRTHLEVVPDGWRVLVTDLNSTNGTVLVTGRGRERRLLPPGEPVAVDLGSVLELADGVSVAIERPGSV